jgi:glycosyltransferase involved in cell wall biosynthesis
MNVLFALYGDFGSNSAAPLMLHARELHRLGHRCAVAVPSGVEAGIAQDNPSFRAVLYAEALANPAAIFPDGRPADIVHAWTPREGVRRFVMSYLTQRPTPWVIYLEDNEGWISRAALSLVGLREDVLLQHSEEIISAWTPEGLSHPLRYESFIGLSDAAVVIQDKLAIEVPPWVPCTTVMPGVDLKFFSPRPPDPALRKRYGVGDDERVIVYPGGLNDFTRPGLEALCLAVGLINRRGTPCRLLRSGVVAMDFLQRLPSDALARVTDLGELPRADLPGLLALADVFVQPGKPEPFEDLRLPGKLPELLATGRPVVLPDTNIASLFRDGVDAVLHRTGSPEEIAEKCLALFADPERARRIGEVGRRFAESHFDPTVQASRLEGVYRASCEAFDPEFAGKLWSASAQESAPALLARKLRLLADLASAGSTVSGAMLKVHARGIEFTQERSLGLETGMAVRDREVKSLKGEIASLNDEAQERAKEIAALSEAVAEVRGQLAASGQTIAEREHHIAAVESSLSWRMTHPLRVAGRIISRFSSFFRS